MIPSYLYHYTSIDSLLKILSTSSIRFKRLDLMNDPLDGYLDSFSYVRKFVYSSSWTAHSADELPMWKMYNDLKGVRLRMPIDLFDHKNNLVVSKRHINGNKNFLICSALDKTYSLINGGTPNDNVLNFSNSGIRNVFGPSIIEYLNSQEDISKNVICKSAKELTFDLFEIDLSQLGQKKIADWSFEKEYRYRLFIADSMMIAGSSQVLNGINSLSPFLADYIDIAFTKQALNDVEIMLGPYASPKDREQVELKLSQIGVDNFIIKTSNIKITAANG